MRCAGSPLEQDISLKVYTLAKAMGVKISVAGHNINGHEIDETALACFSPYQTEHLNRFGQSTLKRIECQNRWDWARVLRMPPDQKAFRQRRLKRV